MTLMNKINIKHPFRNVIQSYGLRKHFSQYVCLTGNNITKFFFCIFLIDTIVRRPSIGLLLNFHSSVEKASSKSDKIPGKQHLGIQALN